MNPIGLILLPLLFCGCGPLIMPMTPRLDADQQKMVDGMWDNMLTPAERLDRDLLLDVLCQYSLYQIGVDRLHLTAEKHFKGGWAVMELAWNIELLIGWICKKYRPKHLAVVPFTWRHEARLATTTVAAIRSVCNKIGSGTYGWEVRVECPRLFTLVDLDDPMPYQRAMGSVG